MSKLKKSNQDPKAWITYLEGLRMKLTDVGSMIPTHPIYEHLANVALYMMHR